MNSELETKLFEKYPKIFRQKDLDMKQTCMCWGIECGDGWYMLIDELCNSLQFHIDHNRHPQIEAVQVKEKWGSLRFYTNGEDDFQHGLISFAETMSNHICEKCGSTDDATATDTSWVQTLCKKCRGDKSTLRDRQFSDKVLNSKIFRHNREKDDSIGFNIE